jgi:hypothetical protein
MVPEDPRLELARLVPLNLRSNNELFNVQQKKGDKKKHCEQKIAGRNGLRTISDQFRHSRIRVSRNIHSCAYWHGEIHKRIDGWMNRDDKDGFRGNQKCGR